MSNQPTRILIAGGAGFLGANLVRLCLRKPGTHITVLDSFDPRLQSTAAHLEEVSARIRIVRGSLLDDRLVAELLEGQDIIFNCAGQTSHTLSMRDPLFDARTNCLGSLTLLETMRAVNRSAVVVYTSTSSVTGKALDVSIDEYHGEKPLDIYSANKGAAEKYYRIYHRAHGLKTVAIRFANLYGPYGKGHSDFGFVNYFIHLARRGEEIRIFGDGSQIRNVMFVEDAAEVLWLAAGVPYLQGETFFAAHDEHFSVREIAETIVRRFGRGSVVTVPWPDDRRGIEIDHVRISSAAFRALTGWRPRYSFDEGLRKTRAVCEETRALEPCEAFA